MASRRETQIGRDLQFDHTYSFDAATTNDGYFSIMLYSLSIFKFFLLMKKLWSSKAANLMKIPFLFDNFKRICPKIQRTTTPNL